MESKGLPLILVCVRSSAFKHFFHDELKNRCEIIEADDLQESVERARNTKLDLMILEDDFGEDSLVGTLTILRRLGKTPTLVITQSLKKEYHRKLLVAGASNFLSLPLDPVELQSHLDRLKKTEEVDKKLGAIATLFPKKFSGKGKAIEGFAIQDPCITLIKGYLAGKVEFCAFLFELDEYEDPETKWALFDESITGRDFKMAPMGKRKRLVFAEKMKESAGKSLGAEIRVKTGIKVGFAHISGKEDLPPQELYEKILENAKANQL